MIQEDDGCLNMSRVTAILPLEDAVWIGTGDGNLIMFDVITTRGMSNASSSVDSPHVTRHNRTNSMEDMPADKIEQNVSDLHKSLEDKGHIKKRKDLPKLRSRSGSKPISRSESKSSDCDENKPANDIEMEVDTTEGGSVTSPDSPKKDSYKSPASPRGKRMLSSHRGHKSSDNSENKGCDEKQKNSSSKEDSPSQLKQQLDENANSKNANCDKVSAKLEDVSPNIDLSMETSQGEDGGFKHDNNNPNIDICDIDFESVTVVGCMDYDGSEGLTSPEDGLLGLGSESASMSQTDTSPSKLSSRECSGESDDTMTSSLIEDEDSKHTVMVEMIPSTKPNKPTDLAGQELALRTKIDPLMLQGNETILDQVFKKGHQIAAVPIEGVIAKESSNLDSFSQVLSPINEGAESSVSEVEDTKEQQPESHIRIQGQAVKVQGQPNRVQGSLPNDAIIAMNRRLLTPDFTLNLDPNCVKKVTLLSPISEGGEGGVSPGTNLSVASATSSSTSSSPAYPTLQPTTADNKPQQPAHESQIEFPSPETDFSPVIPQPPSNTPNMPKRHLEEMLQNGGSGWSSLEESKDGSPGGGGERLNVPKHESKPTKRNSRHGHARSPSNTSLSSLPLEHPFFCEMSLQAKIKISDKPIRCLIHTM